MKQAWDERVISLLSSANMSIHSSTLLSVYQFFSENRNTEFSNLFLYVFEEEHTLRAWIKHVVRFGKSALDGVNLQ